MKIISCFADYLNNIRRSEGFHSCVLYEVILRPISVWTVYRVFHIAKSEGLPKDVWPTAPPTQREIYLVRQGLGYPPWWTLFRSLNLPETLLLMWWRDLNCECRTFLRSNTIDIALIYPPEVSNVFPTHLPKPNIYFLVVNSTKPIKSNKVKGPQYIVLSTLSYWCNKMLVNK